VKTTLCTPGDGGWPLAGEILAITQILTPGIFSVASQKIGLALDSSNRGLADMNESCAREALEEMHSRNHLHRLAVAMDMAMFDAGPLYVRNEPAWRMYPVATRLHFLRLLIGATVGARLNYASLDELDRRFRVVPTQRGSRPDFTIRLKHAPDMLFCLVEHRGWPELRCLSFLRTLWKSQAASKECVASGVYQEHILNCHVVVVETRARYWVDGHCRSIPLNWMKAALQFESEFGLLPTISVAHWKGLSQMTGEGDFVRQLQNLYGLC
jgi:hypothetical protein